MIIVNSVGKISKNSAEASLINEYSKRIKWPFKLNEIPDTKNNNKEIEADKIISNIPKNSFVISMDEHGEVITTKELKGIIETQLHKNDICFIIGGANGLSEKIFNISDKRIAFGRITIPHKLVRLLLVEQIYRAYTIAINHPYHRE